MLKDNRDNLIEGNISSSSDLDEMYREICSNFGWSITKAKAFTKSNHGVTLSGLVRLCERFKLKMEFDVFKDELSIYYQDRDVAPCEYPDQDPEVLYVDDDGAEIVHEEPADEEQVDWAKSNESGTYGDKNEMAIPDLTPEEGESEEDELFTPVASEEATKVDQAIDDEDDDPF